MTTSHFFGLSLKNETFNNIFESLEKYIKENNLKKIIELQNISSLHISLYYFGKNISVSNLEKIKEDLVEINKKENYFPVYINQLNFFKRRDEKHLCYLSPSETKGLERINSKLKQRYISEVPDNDYPKYVPHLSLFKIKDNNLYPKHDDAITTIINKYLKLIKKVNTFNGFNLYSVDSNYSPEKQEIIL